MFKIYTPDDRRSAYLKLSKDLHPDHNTGKSAEENDVIHNQVPDVHYFVSSFNLNRYTRIGQNLPHSLYNYMHYQQLLIIILCVQEVVTHYM